MSKRLALALSLAALALGAACILLGRAVLGERDAVSAANAALAAPLPAGPVPRDGGVAGRLLGTGGDRQRLAAAADYQTARAETALAPAVRERSLAEAELAPLAASGSPERRSWAATLLAVLEFDAAHLDRRGAQRHVQASVAALHDAVAADPANEDAKRDLELLLTLQQQGKGKDKPKQSKQHKPQRHRNAHLKPRADASPPGTGW